MNKFIAGILIGLIAFKLYDDITDEYWYHRSPSYYSLHGKQQTAKHFTQHSTWIHLNGPRYRCSKCGTRFQINMNKPWKRCPVCEAKMDSVQGGRYGQ